MIKTMCLEVYLIWQKKIIENCDKSMITKHFIRPFCFCQREAIFNFFTNLINSKLISELVSSNQSVLCNTSMTNCDKHNNLNLRMRNSKTQ